MFAINAVTGISGWIQKEEMHWLDNPGVPSRFFPGLRGAGTVSEAGEAKLFAGASRTLDEVVIIASSGQPQAFLSSCTQPVDSLSFVVNELRTALKMRSDAEVARASRHPGVRNGCELFRTNRF